MPIFCFYVKLILCEMKYYSANYLEKTDNWKCYSYCIWYTAVVKYVYTAVVNSYKADIFKKSKFGDAAGTLGTLFYFQN